MANRKPISGRRRFAVLKRDAFACRYCGERAPASKLHVDHIIPVARGGTNATENLVTACVQCNLGKGALDFSDLDLIDPTLAANEEGMRVGNWSAWDAARRLLSAGYELPASYEEMTDEHRAFIERDRYREYVTDVIAFISINSNSDCYGDPDDFAPWSEPDHEPPYEPEYEPSFCEPEPVHTPPVIDPWEVDPWAIFPSGVNT